MKSTLKIDRSLFYCARILLLLIALTLSSCIRNNNISAEFIQSSINSTFDFNTDKPFNEYILYAKNTVEKGRIDLGNKSAADAKIIIDWNSPYILTPAATCIEEGRIRRGILLIHGFKSSPFVMRDLAQELVKKCFLVYSILLTGHGTRVGDLQNIAYKDWYNLTSYAIQKLSQKVDNVYIGGHSVGGLLALDYAINPQHRNDIQGLILTSPYLASPNVASSFAKIVSKRSYNKEDDLVSYTNSILKTESMINKEASRVNKEIHDEVSLLRLNNMDIFVAASYDDLISTSQPAVIESLLRVTNPQRRSFLLYYTESNPIPTSVLTQTGVHSSFSFLKSDLIISMSHIAIPIDRNNLWYGKNAIYRNCSHYYDSNLYNDCRTRKNIISGELQTFNDTQDEILISRLTYNPFFKELMLEINNFFDF